MPLVSVITVNYNGITNLLKCLTSLRRTDYPNFEIIVVDNHSADGSKAAVRREFKEVRLLVNQANYGYAGGSNVGIKQACGEYIVLLNNDTRVTPNWLSELVTVAEKEGDCFLQPKILLEDSPTVLNSAGNSIHIAGFGLPKGAGDPDTGQYDDEIEIGYASGACILASRHMIEVVGMLDERYFLQHEDLDWGWRARMQGLTSRYVPRAVIYHQWGGTLGRLSNEKFFYLERNRLYTLLKNCSRRTLIVLVPVLIAIEIFILFYSAKNGWFPAKIKSYRDLIRMRWEIVERRRDIQRKRKRSDTYVFSIFTSKLKHPFLKSPALNLANAILSRWWNAFSQGI